jgi:hypothetical protein
MSRDTEDCWLCTFASEPTAMNITNAIQENIVCTDVEIIAKQCQQAISQFMESLQCNTQNPNSYSIAQICKHINQHMLQPNITLALTLRNLKSVSDRLRSQLCTVNDEGDAIVDSTQVKNYLLVVSQITNIYKLGETQKLLFARTNESGK